MTEAKTLYLDGVIRFPEPDEADPVQLLWRLQSEARRQPNPNDTQIGQ